MCVQNRKGRESTCRAAAGTSPKEPLFGGVAAEERACAVNIPKLTEECIRRHSEEGEAEAHHDCKICSAGSNGAGDNVREKDLGKRKRVKKTRVDV